MIARELKLKLTKKQEADLNRWLWNLAGVYNFGIQKIKLALNSNSSQSVPFVKGKKKNKSKSKKKKVDVEVKNYVIDYTAKNSIERTIGCKKRFSEFDFMNLLAGTSKKLDIPSHVICGTLKQAFGAWDRCFKKLGGQPKFKSKRNKLNSIPFPDWIKAPIGNQIKLPLLGKVRFYAQELPEGKIKTGRIVKRASGWYLVLTIDAVYKFPVKKTSKSVGIDPGFSTLLTLSNGNKVDNPKEISKGAERLAQAQRGINKKLVARLHERQAARRKNRNHEISRRIVEEYKTIYYSNDNLKGLAQTGFGKSVAGAGLGQLFGMITYKGANSGRTVKPVNSRFTTQTCNVCWSITGPKGKSELKVRQWHCNVCGTDHDRDINAAMVVLKVGSGCDHESVRKARPKMSPSKTKPKTVKKHVKCLTESTL